MPNVALDILTLLIGASSLLIRVSVSCVGGVGWLDRVNLRSWGFQVVSTSDSLL